MRDPPVPSVAGEGPPKGLARPREPGEDWGCDRRLGTRRCRGLGLFRLCGESASVDSLMRDIARAPGLTPRGSTLESSSVAVAVLVAGTLIGGRFRLERMLGEGGMGVVWAATHAVTRKPVALKFLKRSRNDDARAVQRFLREARAACAVRHPSVVEVHDVLELEDGSPVMVMDLLSGETLAQRLTRERVMSLPDVTRIMVHVCSAVGCAHALGIVHRDLKPENIFLVQSPSGRAVKVLDFGIAKLTASEGDAAQTGVITGTGAILELRTTWRRSSSSVRKTSTTARTSGRSESSSTRRSPESDRRAATTWVRSTRSS